MSAEVGKDYRNNQKIIEIIKFVDSLKKKKISDKVRDHCLLTN